MSAKTASSLKFNLALILLLLTCGLWLNLSAYAQEPADESWEQLLSDNYQDLWRGYKDAGWPQGWSVEEGVLSRPEGGDDLMTVATYGDFILELEWKISPGGNSGIMYRVSTGDDAPYLTGPEFQILDDSEHSDGEQVSTSAGSLYGLYARENDVSKPAGEWNLARIVVRGDRVEHWLNNKKVVECQVGSDDWNKRVKGSKFAKWEKFGKNREGHIALQDHNDPVWYRNIRVRRLDKRQ